MKPLFFHFLLFTIVCASSQGLNELNKVSTRDPRVIRLHHIIPNQLSPGWVIWKDFIKKTRSGEKDIVPVKDYPAIFFNPSLKEKLKKYWYM